MTNKLTLLSERGGYQLYYFDGQVHPLSAEVPLEIVDTIPLNDKLKFFVGTKPPSDIFNKFPEDPLNALIRRYIDMVDSSNFRHILGGSEVRVDFAGDTLEETIGNLKRRKNPFERSSAHWHDYALVRKGYFGANHHEIYPHPLGGLPRDLLQIRLTEQEEYQCLRQMDQLIFWGNPPLCGAEWDSRDDDSENRFFEKVRAKDRDTIKIVVDAMVREHGERYNSGFVESVLNKAAFNELEYERLGTNLRIRNYLQSRISE